MKKFIVSLIITVLISFVNIYAQGIADYNVNELEYTPVNDPDFDWSQFENKVKGRGLVSKALIGKKGLELFSMNGSPAISVCKLPINMNSEDFIVSLKMLPLAVSKGNPFVVSKENLAVSKENIFGIVYDYKDDSNYKALYIVNKEFEIIQVENGNISLVDKGLYKKDKEKEFTLSITKNKGKLLFGVNGLNLTSQQITKLDYPVFGFYAYGYKLLGKSLAYKKFQRKETEE